MPLDLVSLSLAIANNCTCALSTVSVTKSSIEHTHSSPLVVRLVRFVSDLGVSAPNTLPCMHTANSFLLGLPYLRRIFCTLTFLETPISNSSNLDIAIRNTYLLTCLVEGDHFHTNSLNSVLLALHGTAFVSWHVSLQRVLGLFVVL